MEKEIQNVIQSFFGKHFSKEMQLCFRYWLLLKDDRKEKEAALEEIWENSPFTLADNTWESLSRLQRRIKQTQGAGQRRIWMPFVKYAAVIALLVICGLSAYRLGKGESKTLPVRWMEMYVPYGDYREVRLADGSTAWVNAGSLLIYPEEFTTGSRMVYLNGEARFQVAKDAAKPFIVNTAHLDIRALGTVFNVQAYMTSPVITATLEEGSIRVDTKQNSASASVILKPNEQLTYSCQTHRWAVDTVDAARLSAWKDGYLIFENASFREVVEALERKYGVTIHYDAGKYHDSAYYLKITPQESIEDALQVLSNVVKDFKFTMKGKTISIY